jgi:NADH dehydrogenase FAD-containing subunit
VIVGGGFAGGYVARILGKRGATVVSPENFMLYTPMLPEAASGTLKPRHVVVPLRMMCPHAEILQGRYRGIPDVVGVRLRGFPGWFVTRTYHLYQLSLLSRKLRVVADWTVSLFFRRDIAELGMLGHPRRLGDG